MAGNDFELGLVRNTASMRLDPQSPEEYDELDEQRKETSVQLLLVLSGQQFRQTVAYPVMVEMWERIKYGRQRRLWQTEFTEAERRKIASYRGRFYRWHLVSGTPDRVSCRPSTLDLLVRAINFFSQL